MVFIINRHYAIINSYSFTWEGDDTFDNVLITDVVGSGTGHWVFDAVTFVFLDFFGVFIHEDDDLTTFGNIFLS